MKVLWLNGWGRSVAETTRVLRLSWPAEHFVVQPFQGWQSELERHLPACDQLCGYSLGAFLLLGAPDIHRRAPRTHLFAPFFDLRAESAHGGRVPLKELEGMKQLVCRDKKRALERFSRRAQLTRDGAAADLPQEELLWGLNLLMTESRSIEAGRSYSCSVGEKDALLDSQALSESIKNLRVSREAGHCLSGLVKEQCALR